MGKSHKIDKNRLTRTKAPSPRIVDFLFDEWLQNAEKCELAQALSRLAQLDQSKVYLFWKKVNGVDAHAA